MKPKRGSRAELKLINDFPFFFENEIEYSIDENGEEILFIDGTKIKRSELNPYQEWKEFCDKFYGE